MEKKYEFTNFSIMYKGHRLHQIRALRDFGNIKKGDVGGHIEGEGNLSHKGDCWVYDNAYVYEDAQICGNAQIGDYAKIYGHSLVLDNTCICGKAIVRDYATISDGAIIQCSALVQDSVEVKGQSIIRDNVVLKDRAVIINSYIEGNICIDKENCITNAIMFKNNLEEQIRCQTGLIPCNGEIIAYKMVRSDLTSFFDKAFQYKIGEWAEAKVVDESEDSCGGGLHFSNATYWDKHNPEITSGKATYLIAKIKLEDIITVQQGKIRCRKAFILGRYNVGY